MREKREIGGQAMRGESVIYRKDMSVKNSLCAVGSGDFYFGGVRFGVGRAVVALRFFGCTDFTASFDQYVTLEQKSVLVKLNQIRSCNVP